MSEEDDAGKGTLIKKLTSPCSVLTDIISSFSAYAGRRTLVLFCFGEIVNACLCITWYSSKYYHRTAQLGYIITLWKVMIGLDCLRLVFVLFGVVAIWKRKVGWCRLFFGLLCINGMICCQQLVPIAKLRCKCSNWSQCLALSAFSCRDYELRIPFHPPDITKYELTREVPYEPRPKGFEPAQNNMNAKIKKKRKEEDDDDEDEPAKEALLETGSEVRAAAKSSVQVDKSGHLVRERLSPDSKLQVSRELGEAKRHVQKESSVDVDSVAASVQPAASVTPGRKGGPRSRKSYLDQIPPQSADRVGALAQVEASRRLPPKVSPPETSAAEPPCKEVEVDGMVMCETQEERDEEAKRLLGDTASMGSVIAKDAKLLDAVQHKNDDLCPLHFFNITDTDLLMVTNADPDHMPICGKSVVVSSVEKDTIVRRLGFARKDPENAVFDVMTHTRLVRCAVSQRCNAVSVEISKMDDKLYEYKVCEMEGQNIPKLIDESINLGEVSGSLLQSNVNEDTVMAHYNNDKTVGMFFVKNPKLIKEDLDVTEMLGEVPSEIGMSLLSKYMKGLCTCEDNANTQSCKVYRDDDSQDRFWCHVAAESQDKCTAAALPGRETNLYWDLDAKKLWTDDICSKGCQCSGKGMVPTIHNGTQRKVDTSLLGGNGISYGSKCNKWNTDDKEPWCYVGIDSTCVDRIKEDVFWPNSMPEHQDLAKIPMQFMSKMPCGGEDARTHHEESQDLCETMKIVSEIGMILWILTYIPFVIILFKYIANRCGEDFQASAPQFEVVISSSEDSDASKEGEGTKDAKDKKPKEIGNTKRNDDDSD